MDTSEQAPRGRGGTSHYWHTAGPVHLGDFQRDGTVSDAVSTEKPIVPHVVAMLQRDKWYKYHRQPQLQDL